MNAITITKDTPKTNLSPENKTAKETPVPSKLSRADDDSNFLQNAGTQIQAMVDRTIQRNIKGLNYLISSKPDVGLTPKDVLIERGTMRLYHYHPMADEVYRIPILLVMATTNKSYIFDLAPGQSMVEYLLKAGYDVFVLDWEEPKPEERGLTLSDYTQDFIPSAIRRITEETGEPDVSVIGYCMGGVLSLIYAATHPDGPLRNLICMTTPVNWKEMGLFHAWTDERHFDVDHLVDTLGNVPGDMLFTSFDMLRPANRPAGRIQLWDNMWNDQFVASYRLFDRWSQEMLPLAGEYYRQTTKEVMWRNKLFTGDLVIDGKSADLGNVKVPIMHAIAKHDHIVPFAASQPLLEKVGSTEKEKVVLKGGHVSLIAGPNAVRRLWPQIDNWLGEKSV